MCMPCLAGVLGTFSVASELGAALLGVLNLSIHVPSRPLLLSGSPRGSSPAVGQAAPRGKTPRRPAQSWVELLSSRTAAPGGRWGAVGGGAQLPGVTTSGDPGPCQHQHRPRQLSSGRGMENPGKGSSGTKQFHPDLRSNAWVPLEPDAALPKVWG